VRSCSRSTPRRVVGVCFFSGVCAARGTASKRRSANFLIGYDLVVRKVYRWGRRRVIRQERAGVRFATLKRWNSTGMWRHDDELGRVGGLMSQALDAVEEIRVAGAARIA